MAAVAARSNTAGLTRCAASVARVAPNSTQSGSRRSAENDDTFVNAFYNLGLVYRQRQDLDLAGEAFQRALKLNPDMLNARYNLALVYYELKQDDESAGELKKILGRYR